MNSRLYAVSKALLSLAGLAFTLISSGSAWAGLVSGCTDETCTWMIRVDGEIVMQGSYQSDADTGQISLANPVNIDGGDYTVSLDSMNGNIDPVLGFGLGASNTSGAIKTFAFAFSLPLGGLPAPLITHAELGTTLTPLATGGRVFPTLGGGNIVDSQDIRINPFASVDKGVDVGAGTATTGGTTVLNFESADGSINAGGPFDVMSVTVAFGLTDQTTVGMSGKVEQTVVPVPPTVWLFGSGLLGIVGIARRRKKA